MVDAIDTSLMLKMTKNEIMNQVKFVYKCYQLENLTDGFCDLSADKDGNVNRNRHLSYWKEASSLLNINIAQSESN